MAEYVASHAACGAADPQQLPTRILKIEQGGRKVRLHASEGESAQYVTLSYCWGNSPLLPSTGANLTDYLRDILLAVVS